MDANAEGARPEILMNQLLFETAILKTGAGFITTQFQPFAWTLIQTGDHLLRPRYRFLLLGGFKVQAPADIDPDEFVSTIDVTMSKLQQMNPRDESAITALSQLREEVKEGGSLSFEMLADVFTRLMSHMRLPMLRLKRLLQALVDGGLMAQAEADGLSTRISRGKDTFRLDEISELLKEELRTMDDGKVVTRLASNEPDVEMTEAGYYCILTEPAHSITSPSSIASRVACGPPELRATFADVEEATAETTTQTDSVSAPEITGENLTQPSENEREGNAVDDYPIVEIPPEEDDNNRAHGAVIVPVQQLTDRDKELAKMLELIQASSTVVTVPLDDLMTMFASRMETGIFDPDQMAHAKEELQKAAKPAPNSSSAALTVPLPIVLDVFVRVFGVRVPTVDNK